MGKLSSQPEPTIQHFSHPHPLKLFNHPQPQQTLNLASCSACKLRVFGWIYSCQPCSFLLHVECSQMPQLIKHQFDQNHALSLLPKPNYDEGFFNCDACGKQGTGFSYHCKDCNIDLHVLCASTPSSITHQSHHHQLNLTFSPPYGNQSFSCDICKTAGSNHWLYRCNSCEFDAHLNCATNKQTVAVQAPIQIQQGYQKATAVHVQGPVDQMQQFQSTTSRATPLFQTQYPAAKPSLQNYPPNYLGNQGVFGSVLPAVKRQDSSLNLEAILGAFAASEASGQQLAQALMAGGGGSSGNYGRTIQLLQQLMGNGGGGGGTEQFLSALMSGGGGGDGNGQLLQALMGGGTGGGLNVLGGNGATSFDLSSILGGFNGLDIGGMGGFLGFDSF